MEARLVSLPFHTKMLSSKLPLSAVLVSFAALASAHCASSLLAVDSNLNNEALLDTFPSLIVNGAVTPAWADVRKTNNFDSNAPVRTHL